MPVINKVRALPNQTLVDLALQEAGSVEALFEVSDINGLSITDDLVAGVGYEKPVVVNKQVVIVFNGVNKPASGISAIVRPGGIGYMQIGNDFIVS